MDRIKTREDEATSNETLEDVEESTTDTDVDDTDGPSPDGALDEPDELENAGPM